MCRGLSSEYKWELDYDPRSELTSARQRMHARMRRLSSPHHDMSGFVKLKPANTFWSMVLSRSLSGGVSAAFSIVKSVSKLLTSLGSRCNRSTTSSQGNTACIYFKSTSTVLHTCSTVYLYSVLYKKKTHAYLIVTSKGEELAILK